MLLKHSRPPPCALTTALKLSPEACAEAAGPPVAQPGQAQQGGAAGPQRPHLGRPLPMGLHPLCCPSRPAGQVSLLWGSRCAPGLCHCLSCDNRGVNISQGLVWAPTAGAAPFCWLSGPADQASCLGPHPALGGLPGLALPWLRCCWVGSAARPARWLCGDVRDGGASVLGCAEGCKGCGVLCRRPARQ